jgi:hypothetical protein
MNALGLTQQFTATVEDKKGKAISGIAIIWSSTDRGVASVSASGLVTGLRKGTTTIKATAEGLSDQVNVSVDPIPAQIQKVSGDDQTGALNQTLPGAMEFEVQDSQGNGLIGIPVTLAIIAGDGSVSPTFGTTDAFGRFTATWTLGCSGENPQQLEVRGGGHLAVFSATADLELPAICGTAIPNGRETFPFQENLEVVGGDQATMVWSLDAGFLPQGVSLSAQGLLEGIPGESGSFPFTATARDGNGDSAAGEYVLNICEAPLDLAPGESVSMKREGPEGCGFFLPTGADGDRYRFGVLWDTSDPADTVGIPNVTVTIGKEVAAGAPAPGAPILLADDDGRAQARFLRLPAEVREILEEEAAAQAFNRRLRESEMELMRSFGADLPLLPDSRARQRVAPAPGPAPDKLTLKPRNNSQCEDRGSVTALKVGENDHLAIYQDSAQSTVDTLKITSDMAQMMLDYYRDYGKTVVDTYFGGVTDVNGDGRVVVFVTPVVEEAAAYVWSGDFYPSTECAASNEMELVRFRASFVRRLVNGGYQPLGTMVHEVKHLSSLYNALARWRLSGETYGYHPGWVEEGTATMAGEISSRLAWADAGGPAVGAMVRRSDRVTNADTYYMIVALRRSLWYLSSQPNGTVAVPRGAGQYHSIYGSGYHFHRWLGDAYGDAATPLADGALFTAQNDSLSASGVHGIENLTGNPWSEILDEYAAAIMLNGTGAPPADREITSYDFPDVTAGLYSETYQPPGAYPWPVNLAEGQSSAPFQSAVITGKVGPSGIRVYDLTSDGTGVGVEVTVETTREPLRVVVARVN